MRTSLRTLAAKTVIAVTSATPISTGAAVRAVRFGLRAAFCRAIAPVTPRSFSIGRPRLSATGFAIPGPMMSTPANTKSTPIPSKTFDAPAAVAVMAPAPSNIATTPMVTRRVTLPTFSSAVSRKAANGGTRPARSAGRIADRIVITVPTIMVSTIRFV